MYIENILMIVGVIGSAVSLIGLASYIITNKKIKIKQAIEDDSNMEYITQTMIHSSAIEESNNTIIDQGITELDDEVWGEVEQDYDYLHTVVFQGRYVIDWQMAGGGMSHVYAVKSSSLGSNWLIKHIEPQFQSLMREEDILKKLNHTNLPKIVDVFYDISGTYIVQSFIEGISLDKVIASELALTQYQIYDWAKQLTEVLDYLHTLKPSPIIHRDLKPANIIVSHSDKLVLIDFGISKEEHALEEIHAITKHYASPEQYKKQKTDSRSDIYSLGVILFELATKKKPNKTNHILLTEAVSQEFGNIILKCIKENPAERYQSSRELLTDLEQIQSSRLKFAQTLVRRKVVFITSICALIASVSVIFISTYIANQQKLSFIELVPGILKISEQQSKELVIMQEFDDGEIKQLAAEDITWLHADNNIAKIDGNFIVGMNEGFVEFVGQYRNKIISTEIQVVKPMDGMVEISLKYDPTYRVLTAFGTGQRDHVNGSIANASFVAPESLTQTDDGTLLVVDSGSLRKISDDTVETIMFSPYYMLSDVVRSFENEVYVLTHPWEEADGRTLFGISRVDLSTKTSEQLYVADSMYMDVIDFTLDNNGDLLLIVKNGMMNSVEIHKVDTETKAISPLARAYMDTASIAVDNNNVIYISNSERGTIEKLVGDNWEYVAGIENSRNFVDGNVSQFYRPQKITYHDGDFYVIDYNVIRKIIMEDGIVVDVITVAGEVSTAKNVKTINGRASDIIFDGSILREIVVSDDVIYVSDPSNSVIRKIVQ